MSVRAVAYMKQIDVCPNGEMITRTEKFVGMILGDAHQDRRDRHTFPSVDEIAKDARVSERQCQRVMDALERKGIIRREYPAGRGRGKMTYYIFPELDEEGCHGVTLFPVQNARPKTGKRVTEGCHKGDISGTAYKEEHEQVQQELNPPQPPSQAKGEEPLQKSPIEQDTMKRSVDSVMTGCGFVQRRLRKILYAVMEQEAEKGIPAPGTAEAMVEAWKRYVMQELGLKWRVRPREFFEIGMWRDERMWHWDRVELDRMRERRVGLR